MELSPHSTGNKFTIAESKDGSMTLLVTIDGREFPFHSRVAPAREATDPAPDHEKYDLVIALGCGLGYTLIPLKESLYRYRQVIIIDVLAGIENEIRNNMLTKFLTEAGNVTFITGRPACEVEHILAERVNLDELKGIHVREHATSLKLFPGYYSEVKSSIKRLLDKKASGAATVKAFGRIFLRNALFNIDALSALHPVAALAGAFRGYRGLVVSSAPSVEEHIGHIAANRNSMVIMAVDSALPLLERHGIRPDLCVSIDPQHRINEHLLGHAGHDTAHVFSIVSPPGAVKKYGGFISLNTHPVAQVIERLYPGITGSVDSSTGSVAGDALSLALLCGFDKTAMTGFDFSFTHNNIYARGTAYQQRYATMFNTRLRTPESFNAEYIFRASRGYTESGRYTRRSFTGYRESLSGFIAANCPGRVSWISKGLVPQGVVCTTFEEFMNAPVIFENAGNAKRIIMDAKNSTRSVDPEKIKRFIARENIWEQMVAESTGAVPGDRGYSNLRKRFLSM